MSDPWLFRINGLHVGSDMGTSGEMNASSCLDSMLCSGGLTEMGGSGEWLMRGGVMLMIGGDGLRLSSYIYSSFLRTVSLWGDFNVALGKRSYISPDVRAFSLSDPLAKSLIRCDLGSDGLLSDLFVGGNRLINESVCGRIGAGEPTITNGGQLWVQ